MIDRPTKLILIAIAAGLWANVAAHMTKPANAHNLTSINDNLTSIRIISTNIETYLSELALGSCRNQKLCSP